MGQVRFCDEVAEEHVTHAAGTDCRIWIAWYERVVEAVSCAENVIALSCQSAARV